jgi:hypothetical protein
VHTLRGRPPHRVMHISGQINPAVGRMPAQPRPTADSQSAEKLPASALEEHASAVAGGNAGVVVGAEALPCPGADGRIDVGTPTAAPRQGGQRAGRAATSGKGGRCMPSQQARCIGCCITEHRPSMTKQALLRKLPGRCWGHPGLRWLAAAMAAALRQAQPQGRQAGAAGSIRLTGRQCCPGTVTGEGAGCSRPCTRRRTAPRRTRSTLCRSCHRSAAAQCGAATAPRVLPRYLAWQWNG